MTFLTVKQKSANPSAIAPHSLSAHKKPLDVFSENIILLFHAWHQNTAAENDIFLLNGSLCRQANKEP